MMEFWIEVAILIATIFAIIFGPIKAVKITRELDRNREIRARRYSILADLMQTRRARLDPIHVRALNLIELEFYGVEAVKNAFSHYVSHLNSIYPKDPDELNRHLDEGDDRFAELLRVIANELGFSFDKGDLKRRAYMPEGLGRQNDNAAVNTYLLREVLEGRRPLHISNYVEKDGLFPPTPGSKKN